MPLDWLKHGQAMRVAGYRLKCRYGQGKVPKSGLLGISITGR